MSPSRSAGAAIVVWIGGSKMHFSKLVQCRSVTGSLISVNIRITDEAWNKCNGETRDQVETLLRSEPIQILSTGGHSTGIKWEGDHWVFHTQTAQRLATDSCSMSDLTWNGMTFDRTYKH